MDALAEHFRTDWAAMTAADWVGTILTVVIFIAMLVAYFQVFRPKNRESLESRKHILFEEDRDDLGDDDGRK
ncbi:MAG: cbb3-type cytochrome c oxidase subunit 3 [Thiohalocapsa sp.]|jgi:cytochrome c oxidase cbb3-type subunit 4|uniref:cbb3-type cytochrome c oxidase subunit 3 n=1 Tax=Thiohalocapsa sp. TaxID=2497641 RepID=UPI0025FA9EA6|nr:cbb3-type cytochrome c oxidase subunit 3 [Thiohalocapsa sp.]MCG6942187.1 cbb3-type cytochrome c oxidase subunit 3 [Thiohalocapsa sp.]